MMRHYKSIILSTLIAWFTIFAVFVLLVLPSIQLGAPIDWIPVTGLATWVLAGGVLLTFRQIIETRQSNSTQIFISFYRDFRSIDNIERLKNIYRLQIDDPSKLELQQVKDIGLILDIFEAVGSISKRGTIDQWMVVEIAFGLASVRCWYKLCSYVKIEQIKRGYFGDNFEAFARDCLDYFERRHIPLKLYWDDKTSIDLIAELKKEDIRPRSFKEIEKQRIKPPEKS